MPRAHAHHRDMRPMQMMQMRANAFFLTLLYYGTCSTFDTETSLHLCAFEKIFWRAVNENPSSRLSSIDATTTPGLHEKHHQQQQPQLQPKSTLPSPVLPSVPLPNGHILRPQRDGTHLPFQIQQQAHRISLCRPATSSDRQDRTRPSSIVSHEQQ